MMRMTNMSDIQLHGELKEVCDFLANYAACMLGCGATCIRIEKNVMRIAQAFDKQADMVILPSHVSLTVWDMEHTHSYHDTVKIYKMGISLYMITELSRLSWQIADGKVERAEAIERFYAISASKPINRWVVLFLASLANMSFCRLFGGDATSMLIVFVATLAGFYLKQILLADKMDVRVVTIASAFFASVIGSAGYVFGWGDTPELALGTSVLFLIPGIPYINSVSDLLDGHYLCSFSRFIQASVLTVCISLGLCGGLLLMHIKWV